MSARSSSTWKLVREIGLDYARDPVADESLALLCPVSAERTRAGGLLIIDDLLRDGDPPRMRYRTLVLSAGGRLLYDSSTQGDDDAFGCLMSHGQFAVLQRSRSRICIHSHAGEVIGSVDISGISRHRPKLLCWSPRGSFIVAFVAGRRELDFAEVDGRGKVLWSCIESIPAIGVPSSMQPLPDGSILVADEFRHVIWQLNRDGSTAIRWGNWHSPSSSVKDLHRPRCAQLVPGGNLLIADSSNARILVVDRAGGARSLRLKNRAMFSPTSVRKLASGNYLICDAGSRCVFELDSRGACSPRHGSLSVRKRHFSFPRSVQHMGGNRYLVANTGRNTIVDIDLKRLRELPVRSTCGLFWPRAARWTDQGTILVADGRNSRVLELSARGNELHQLKQCRYKEHFLTLQDPHDIRVQPNRNLLIVDSPQNLVIETNWNGRALWAIGLDGDVRLKDPHSAQQLPDGRIMIADTHNHRIVFVDPRTGASSSITELRLGALHCRLRLPRYAELADDGTLAIADAGNHRVLLTNLKFNVLSVLNEIPESPISCFRAPRWVSPISRDEVIVSDYGNHRLLHFRRRAASASHGIGY